MVSCHRMVCSRPHIPPRVPKPHFPLQVFQDPILPFTFIGSSPVPYLHTLHCIMKPLPSDSLSVFSLSYSLLDYYFVPLVDVFLLLSLCFILPLNSTAYCAFFPRSSCLSFAFCCVFLCLKKSWSHEGSCLSFFLAFSFIFFFLSLFLFLFLSLIT